MIGKQSIAGTIINYVGVIIGYANTILLFPLYFSPEEFGLTRVLLSISVFLTQISQLGLGQVIIKFLPYFKEKESDLKSFIFYITKLSVAGTLLVTIIIFFADSVIIDFYPSESKFYLEQYFYLVLPLTIFLTAYEVADSILKSYFKTVFSTFIKEVFIRLVITFLIFLYYFKAIDFSVFVMLFVSIYALSFFVLLVALKYTLPSLKTNLKPAPIKAKLSSYMFKYGLFALLTTAGTILINNIDILMLGYLVDLKSVAVYSVAFYIAVIIQIPQRNLGRIITPVLSESWKQKDIQKIGILYKKSSVILFFIGAYIFSAIWMSIDNMFAIMPKSEIYKQGKYVVLFIGLSKVIDMLVSINTEIISVSRFYVFNFISLFILILLAIITNYLLIPAFGANGAALATLISISLYSIIKVAYLKLKLNILPFSRKEIFIMMLMAVFIFLPHYFETGSQNNFVQVFIKSFIVTTSFVLLAYLLGIHKLITKENLR